MAAWPGSSQQNGDYVVSMATLKTTVWFWIFTSVIIAEATNNVPFTLQERDNIRAWADALGHELWDLGQTVTRAMEMRAYYNKLNVRVQRKDGEKLLHDIVENVERMMQRKMDAVKCIMSAAEDAAEFFDFSEAPENYTYYSSKNSFIAGEEEQSEWMNNSTYKPMELKPDRHFYNIPVNFSHSSVHVPTNVYDKGENSLKTILWSEYLDDVFMQNFNSDPALKWQYFGSAYGVMRGYPAMKWRADPDLFDCRNRFWYIEAATCTKDIVILLDTTGSMKGYRHTIAKLTVNNILDTLGNNDFVNVFNFSSHATEVVPCFKDMLVQATLENVNTLKDALEEIEPEGYMNLTSAFVTAFQLLERYREIRECSNSSAGKQCNQAIMLITDGVPGNVTEVFQAYNWQENSTYIPVRVFTFLIGQEVTRVREIQWMACLNRGYYVHIHSLNEVREQVFKYIPVIARPLVLQGVLHPTIWTPAYADTTDPTIATWLWDTTQSVEHKKQMSKHARNKAQYFSQRKEDLIYIRGPSKDDGKEEPNLQEYHLMVSVSIPAFDRQLNKNNETRVADLLGVAGTDVPIKDIEKLTYTYKSGVNGYAFIVTNNGYVLLHPDLRPVFRGILKKNYNSIDLTEIELLDDSRGPRELSPEIVELRNAMVNHSEGKMLNLPMKYHYDDMRRVAAEYRSYYYAPLLGTPFTVGLSLPNNYGSYYINPGNEVEKSRHRKIPIINYLKQSGWRIQPDWTYCKYHHESFHNFATPEEELTHFMVKMGKSSWKWSPQYDPKDDSDSDEILQDSLVFVVENGTEEVNCNRRNVGTDEYYCDKELVQLFTFDARVTEPFFRESSLTFRNEYEEELVHIYNVTLKFVATQSGLTRWLNFPVPENMEENTAKEVLQDKDVENGNVDQTTTATVSENEDADDDDDDDEMEAEPEGEDISIEDEEEKEDGDDQVASEEKEQFEENIEFGDLYSGAIEEPWYQSAVLQHEVDPDSFVYSVPFDAGSRENALVTAAHAIFPRDGGMEAPAAVVGLQFPHESLYSRFISITSKTFCKECKSCASEELDCFVLDNNGFVVFAEDQNSTGKFFGEVDGAIMDALRTNNAVYRKIPVFDYQGLCIDETHRIISDASILSTPFTQMKLLTHWLFTQMAYILFEINLSQIWHALQAAASPIIEVYYDSYEIEDLDEEEEIPDTGPKDRIEIIQIATPCDQRTSMYLLQDKEMDKYTYTFEHCSSPHIVQRIPRSNLVLVAIKSTYESCPKLVTSSPLEIHYNGTDHPCQKLMLNDLKRRQLSGCFSEHPEEYEITLCGDSSRVKSNILLFVLIWYFVHLAHIAIDN